MTVKPEFFSKSRYTFSTEERKAWRENYPSDREAFFLWKNDKPTIGLLSLSAVSTIFRVRLFLWLFLRYFASVFTPSLAGACSKRFNGLLQKAILELGFKYSRNDHSNNTYLTRNILFEQFCVDSLEQANDFSRNC